MISEEKKNEFLSLFREFVSEYFSQPRGQEHLRRYIEAKAQGRKNFEEIKDEADRSGVPTEKVLRALLPHTESLAHRQSGAWVHIAPVIQGEIRNWFQAKEWTRAEDWPKIANAILTFLIKCAENPSTIESACHDFVRLPYTTGFQTGMLSPILNALRPNDFMIINNKSRRVINYFCGSSFKQRLTDYPGVNAAGHSLITELQGYMREVSKSDALPADLFDMFCHWLAAEKKFAPVGAGAGEEPPAIPNSADGRWEHHAEVEKRIRVTMERSIPNATMRRAAIDFFALAVESADEERSSAWYVRETGRGVLRLMTGRLLACEVGGPKLRVSVIGPVKDDIRTALAAEAEEDSEFKLVPGSLILTLPVEHAAEALPLLRDGLNSFIEAAMARVRRSVSLEYHVPEAIAYISSIVGRELPQPAPEVQESEQLDGASDEDDAGESHEPRFRGRVPIFEPSQRAIGSLMDDIKREVIALPDLQRPFVWEDTKVRSLLDSLFVGFPVGTLVFWHTSNEKEARALGAERPPFRATQLIIDGQQRLTSLYAVMRGVEVVGKDGTARKITIAFRPRDGRFEVADAAIRNDPEFLPNATELWNGPRSTPQIRRDLIAELRSKGRAVDQKYEDCAERNLDRAHAISDYRFPTIDIRRTAATGDQEVTEEDVAEIFVRINNQGTRLGQADFVLTLLSVYHPELRDRIEERARAMSLGTIVGIDTQQLLRAVCGVAFGRARMSAVYRYLLGVDPTTGEADTERRLRLLAQLDDAAKECMEPTPWRDYLLRVKHAGFVSQTLVASKNAIVNAYAFYIRGRKAGVAKNKLDEMISRWVFGSLLTARYSGSSETTFEEDLTRVGRLEANDLHSFVPALDDAMSERITGDYWTHSLVSALETQKARALAALAFRAAQIVLGTRALFSDQLLHNLFDPPADGGRTASEAHHLFPKEWLQSRGIRDRRRVNQVANLADVGWHDNSLIGGREGPAEYVPRLRERLAINDDRWGRMCAEHALPLSWELMEYEEFLRERRRRMADIIRVAFRQLGGEPDYPPITPPWFLPGAEAVWQRIVETERALRAVVREVYVARFRETAAQKIEEALPEANARPSLARSDPARLDLSQ